jgi:hypothetical protein
VTAAEMRGGSGRTDAGRAREACQTSNDKQKAAHAPD